MSASRASTSCVITAFDCSRNDASDCAGRDFTNCASDAMYSGFVSNNSGVKHHGNRYWITMSATVGSAFAAACQLSSTALMNRSVLVQLLCSDNEATREG